MDGSGRSGPEYLVRPSGTRTRLMLTRKKGEAIVMDGGIKIVVVEMDRNKVKIAIEAPYETGIMREELLREMRQ